MLLGAGELGKELVIALQRLGQYIIAVDSYPGAPGMQVAHESEVIDMLDADALNAIVTKHKPDLVVPEIEAIRTECFYEYEKQGVKVVPSAKAANFTMNRKSIRDLAAIEVGLLSAKYKYATSLEELIESVKTVGTPCVVKPLMSSSGKGQSVIKTMEDCETAWNYALEGSRGDIKEIIVEAFVDFEYEITLLTVTQKDGETLFCPPIGHTQDRGDYRESWQPMAMNPAHLKEAQRMAFEVTKALTGEGIWGVEFFITKDGPVFSELSPRPHDTGMVTLAGTQTFNEFELHARAILGIPIPQLELVRNGASAVILATDVADTEPFFIGIDKAASYSNSDLRFFGKPTTRPYRRMAVALTYGTEEVSELTKKAREIADCISVK